MYDLLLSVVRVFVGGFVSLSSNKQKQGTSLRSAFGIYVHVCDGWIFVDVLPALLACVRVRVRVVAAELRTNIMRCNAAALSAAVVDG